MDTTTLQALAKHTGGPLLPVYCNVFVRDGRAQVGNGRYTLDVPCDAPNMLTNADRLAAALNSCRGADTTLEVTPVEVRVRSGRIRARLPLSGDVYPVATPDPETSPFDGVADAMRAVAPFAAEDASRPWATAVCLSGRWAYATNNVCVARHPLPIHFDTPVNVPSVVVNSLSERGRVRGIGYSENSVTFYYPDGSWLRTLLIAGEWPADRVNAMLEAVPVDEWLELHPELSSYVNTAAKLAEDRLPTILLKGTGIALSDDTFTADDLGPLPDGGALGARMASLVLKVATHIQWHTPVRDRHAFKHGDLTGLMAGVHA